MGGGVLSVLAAEPTKGLVAVWGRRRLTISCGLGRVSREDLGQWFWCGLKGSRHLGPSPLTCGATGPLNRSELSSLSCDMLYPTRLPTMARSALGLHPRTSWSSSTLAPPTCGCLLSTARARPAVSAGWAAKGTDAFLRRLGGNPLLERMVVVCSHVTCPRHVKRLALQQGGSITFLAKQYIPPPTPDQVTHSIIPSYPS